MATQYQSWWGGRACGQASLLQICSTLARCGPRLLLRHWPVPAQPLAAVPGAWGEPAGTTASWVPGCLAKLYGY